jgi:hypothetical protein
MFAREDDYEELSDRRDLAAYRALGAMTAAICFCRQGKTADAMAVLIRAVRDYELVDQQLQSLKLRPIARRCSTIQPLPPWPEQQQQGK